MARHIITLQARNCGKVAYENKLVSLKVIEYANKQIELKRKSTSWNLGYRAALVDIIEYVEQGCQDEK